MTWVKLDEQFPDHPKVIEAGPLAKALFIDGLCYANRLLTDGFIPGPIASRLEREYAEFAPTGSIIARLIVAGLWTRDEARGGYAIHDFLDHQPSAEKVKAEREAAKERMRRLRSGEVRPNNSRSSPEVRDSVPTRSAGSKEPASPPTPPQPIKPMNGTAPASEFADFVPTYSKTLSKGLARVVGSFRSLDVGITEGWIKTVLVEAEREAGPLPRDKLQEGLHVAYAGLERAITAERKGGKAIGSIRGLTRSVIIESLKEQATDAHVA